MVMKGLKFCRIGSMHPVGNLQYSGWLVSLSTDIRLTTAVDSISLKASVTNAVEATNCVIASSIVMANIQAMVTFIHIY